MALAPLALDDITWAQLVDGARARMAAASKGRWTLHAPVDPGVTILDLTAWLLEQRLYWLDQVSDPLAHAIGALHGERCRSARPAATVLGLQTDDRTGPATIHRWTHLWLHASDQPIAFMLADDVTALPIARLRIEYQGRDRADDLTYAKTLDLTGSGDDVVEAKIVLELDASYQPPSTALQAPIALFVDLETPAGLPLEWLPLDEAVPELARRSVQWSYRSAANADQPFPDASVQDGTLGLRRSGIVRLSPGTDWILDPSPAPMTPPTYTLVLRFDGGAFPVPPRLKHVAENAVIARNIEMRWEIQSIQDWLPLPGRIITLVDSDQPLPIEDTVKLSLLERDGTWHAWERVDDFARSGPEDRVFVVERDRGLLRFGDGMTGRIPLLKVEKDLTNARIEYAVGGGERGNVGSWREWRDREGGASLVATNLVPAEGGRDSETLTGLHERIAAELRRPNRAVVADDFAHLLLRSPGIGLRRVHTVVGHHPVFPCTTVPGAVTVFVVPDAPRADEEAVEDADAEFVAAPQPDAGMLAAARQRLAPARLAGTEVFVCAPRYRRVALSFDVVSSAPSADAMRGRVRKHLTRFLDPLDGGDGKDGWPFGEPLRPSALLREAQEAVGRDGEVRSVAIGLDDALPALACRDVEIGPYDLVVLERVVVRTARPAPTAADRGGIQ